jgi:hypothetical protein
MTDKIRDAVVIHGPGRSGTTLLSEILSLHSDFAWISGYVNRFPSRPILAALNRVMDIDTVERFSRSRRYWPRPAEAYQFWNYYFPQFSNPEIRDGTPQQDHPVECIEAIRQIQRYHGKRRFITKITGAPRAAELAAVFENPQVVYIHRDPRAVVASYYKQRWNYKNSPDRFASKTEIDLLTEYVQLFEMSFRGRSALKAFPFCDVAYEEMVDVPDRFFRNLLTRLGLPHERAFFDRLPSWTMDKQSNEAWRKQFSKEGTAFLDHSLKDYVDFTTGLQGKDA